MKSLVLILLLISFTIEAKNKEPDYEYVHGPFKAVIYTSNPSKGIIYGPQFPYGISIKVDPDQAHNLPDNVIEIIDSLFFFYEQTNPK